MLGAGGAAAAAYFGFPQYAGIASGLGHHLGQAIKNITGFGDYTVNKNSILTGQVPNVSNDPTVQGLTISHKEYIGDVITSPIPNTFSQCNYQLNLSNSQLWEWLAQIACNYEEWVPEGIVFYFKSTSCDSLNSTNTALGQVMMATLYNPYALPFTTKVEMESTEFCTSGLPSQDLMHPIECDPNQGAISTYFVNQLNQNANSQAKSQDLRFSNLGTFYIATQGLQAPSVNIGELWITYQVTLLKPKLFASLGLANDYWYGENLTPIASSLAGNGLLDISVSPPFTVSNANSIQFAGTSTAIAAAKSGSMWFAQGANSTTIHWPVYAFPAEYQVTLILIRAVAVADADFTFTHSSGSYPALSAPSMIQSYQSSSGGPTSAIHTCFFRIRVPGGSVPSFINTPSTTINDPRTEVNYTWQLFINQSPYIPNATQTPYP